MSNYLPTPPDHSGGELARSEPFGGIDRQLYSEMGGGGDSTKMLVRRIMAAFWRYKLLALAILLIGVASGFAASRYMIESQYVVRSTLWVETSTQQRDGPIRAGQLIEDAGWIELLHSYTVLGPVVEELRLYVEPVELEDSVAFRAIEVERSVRPDFYRLKVDPSGARFTLTAGREVIQEGRVGETIGGPVGFRWDPPVEALEPGREIAFSVLTPQDVTRQLSAQLNSRVVEKGQFLSIALPGRDPYRIAQTINAVTTRFVDVAADLKRGQSEKLREILSEQLEYAAENLRVAESELQAFRINTVTLPTDRVIVQAPGLGSTEGTVFGNYFGMKLQVDQLRRDREAIEGVLSRAGPSGGSSHALEVIPSVRNASEFMRVLNELTTKKAAHRALLDTFTPEHSQVQLAAEQVRVLETQVIPSMAAQLVVALEEREASIEARIATASGELREIPERSIEETRLERAVATAAALYGTLHSRYETARLSAVSAIPDVRILDEARVPRTPTNDTERTRLLLMFLAGSFAVAIGVPVLLDRLDPRVRYPEQVTHDLGLPILGAVPHVSAVNGKPKKLGRTATDTAVEAFREIRLNAAHAFGSAGPLVATITSPGIGDGKSFISSNLALAFADLGHKTLLIDGDTRRGQLHRLMGVVRVPGLTDFLAGQASAEEIIQPTSFASLDLIAGGTRMQAGPELLGSAEMNGLIRDLRSRYSVILIDSPPLGAGVDPFILSTLTGNTILVLRNGRTDRDYAVSKLELLDRLPIRILGAVLNDVPASGPYKYYTYLPGYGAADETAADDDEVRQLQTA